MTRANSAKEAVTRVAKKLTARFRRQKTEESVETSFSSARSEITQESDVMARRRRPQADIGVDVLAQAYTPQQTSLKGPFRGNGSARLRDQEITPQTATDRWNDEDHLTNKSGDPRIGTRGRTYEPGEKPLESNKGRR